MGHDMLLMMAAGGILILLGVLLSFKKRVAEWGLRHRKARIWVKLLGGVGAVKLTRYFFGPLVMVIGLFLVVGSVAMTSPGAPPQDASSSTAPLNTEVVFDSLPDFSRDVRSGTLEEAVARYNATQETFCPPNNAQDRCKGYTELTLTHASPYFLIAVRQTTANHTAAAGIDVGEDQFAGIVLREKDGVEVARLPGPIMLLGQENRFALVTPARDNCLGMPPTGEVALFDLQQKQTVYHGAFPPSHFLSTEVGVSHTSVEADLTLIHEEPDPAPTPCDVGETVMRTTTSYALRCQPDGTGCALTPTKEHREKQCLDIGSCD